MKVLFYWGIIATSDKNLIDFIKLDNAELDNRIDLFKYAQNTYIFDKNS